MDEEIKSVVNDILRKSDIESITPKYIRHQVAIALNVPCDSLVAKKQLILDTIMNYSKPSIVQENKDVEALKQLTRFVKALGKGPAIFRDTKCLGPREKYEVVFKRLRDAGITDFSDTPTDSEIIKAQRRRDREKELEDINTDVILPEGRKRGVEVYDTKVYKRQLCQEKENIHTTSNNPTTTKRFPVILLGSDDEAELDL